MKYQPAWVIPNHQKVAPHGGAWIEISLALPLLRHMQSLPTGERGLKLAITSFIAIYLYVAPHGGAWIEIEGYKKLEELSKSRSPRGSVD